MRKPTVETIAASAPYASYRSDCAWTFPSPAFPEVGVQVVPVVLGRRDVDPDSIFPSVGHLRFRSNNYREATTLRIVVELFPHRQPC